MPKQPSEAHVKKSSPRPKTYRERVVRWVRNHKVDTAVIIALVLISAIVSGLNMTNYPQRFEDEGTYISQAQAVKSKNTLAHYTYWYDHPPVGWIQMAGHLAFTDALNRYGSAITAGREFMLLLHLATIVLLYALARRLKIGIFAAGLGTLLYALSPLSVEFGRYVLLDNVAIPWMLAAFLLALSPKRHLMSAIGSAICFAICVLSKETFVVLLPVLLYALWVNSDKRNRRFQITSFSVIFTMICLFYILYAALKIELFPGQGHVSLLGTLVWQLSGREGSGSILDPNSGARGLINYWLNIDFWLMLIGVIALPISFFFKNLRVASFSLLIGLIMILRGGYLPYPYIVMLLPFAALVLAGVIHFTLIKPLEGKSLAKGLPFRMATIGLIVLGVLFITPGWKTKLSALMTVDNDYSSREAVNWVDHNVPRISRIVVESALWTDLQNKGFKQPDPVWLYKTETDPAVSKEIGGWHGINYVILNGPTIGASNFNTTFPTVSEAIKHGQLVAEFGQDNQKILVYKVQQ